ncbi:Sec-independent protein translocase protein TatCy [Neolewinella maritima]|uniref:Sec-independent protein translocase protein TatC n=1 Tax=Neolewinella maritima TaxID=1383882 RepID=A0ABM9AW57_9BACT|nr:twin-arginine translocase subunit TatC [Neolewinella maritima]CAH0998930.1 Sec-independent protein translocase protein TatCy [Neolewinella maritima]
MPLDQQDVDTWKYDTDGKPVPEQEQEMTFIDHLEELRWHVMRALIAICVCGVVLFIFRDWYFRYVLFGPLNDDFPSYRALCRLSDWLGTGGALCMEAPNVLVQAIEFGEMFITSVKMAFVGGFVIGFPYVFYEIWSFIRPGLYPAEQKATRWVILICSLLFFIGVAFGFFIVAPFGTNFLMGFEVGGAVNQPQMASVIGYMIMFTLPAALIFELPVLVYFLAKFGLVTAESMRQYRRHSLVGILILAALLTPPDVVTQILIGVPLYGLYEISIFVAKRAQRQYEASLQ